MGTLQLVATWTDQEVVAGTILGEASGERRIGQVAIGCVIRNRVRNPRWWGVDWRSVCVKRVMFECWDNQFRRIADNRAHASPYWCTAMDIAAGVMSGAITDVTNRADHYLNEAEVIRVSSRLPKWLYLHGEKRTPTVVIGRHSFYRLEIS